MVSCLFAVNAFAQMNISMDGVTIDTNISNPGPGQVVEVSIESFSFDLNGSSIVWTVNGKTQSQGVGLKKTSVIAPKLGIKLNVSAIIKGSDGREITKSITIKSSYVDIIWESNGYTPPFFLGKIPYTYQNSIKLIAIPHISKDGIKEIDPKTLVYSWKRSGKYIDNGQGYGKQSIVIEADDLPRPLEVTVDISTREETEHIKSSINIEPSEPSLVFYEDDSLYGILFNKSLTGRIPLKNSEMKVLAVPFGFNLKNQNNAYTWSINNIEQTDLSKNRSIVIRTKGDTSGSSSVNLDMRNLDSILQGAVAGFTVYFNKKQSNDVPVTF